MIMINEKKFVYLDSRTDAIRIHKNAGGFRIPIRRSAKSVLDAL